MKTKLFAIAAAAALFAASCTEAELQTPAGAGQEVTVSFQVNAPEAIATKAFSDGKTATNLYYAVYAEDSKEVIYSSNDETDPIIFDEDLKARVEVTLVTGKSYDLIFWAQNPTAPYVFDMAAQTLTVDYSKVVSNNELLDAFYHTVDSYQVIGPRAEDVELRRPFAQVNVGTDDEAVALKSGIEVKESTMTVKGVYTTLNLFNGAVSNPADVAFAYAAIPSDENDLIKIAGKDYGYMAMNYILVAADKATTTVDFTLKTNEHEIPYNITNVPVQRNYRTNIYGSLLTNPTVWNIEIVPEYYEPSNDVLVGNFISNEEDLVAALAEGGVFTLAEDITLTKAVTLTKDAVLNFNGKTLEYTGYDAENQLTTMSAILVKSAELTVVGTGSFTSNGYVFNTSSQGTGGTINLDGDIEYKSANATVLQVGNNGKATITAGTFSLEGSDKTFLLNKVDNRENDIIVKGGTFNGFNPADNKAEGANTNYVAKGYRSVLTAENTWTVIKNGGVYNVDNVQAYNWFAKNVGTFTNGETVKLGCDLDFNKENTSLKVWSAEKPLNFDGNGHTVKNLSEPLFNGATVNVKNLTIDGANIVGTGSYKGAIGGNHYGNIVNCTVKNATIESTSEKGTNIGALVGIHNGGNITDCYVENVTLKGYHSVGAFVGRVNEQNNRLYDNCDVKGATLSITCTEGDGATMIGGIVGVANGKNLTLRGCQSEDVKINGEASASLFGGVGTSYATYVTVE